MVAAAILNSVLCTQLGCTAHLLTQFCTDAENGDLETDITSDKVQDGGGRYVEFFHIMQ